MHVHVCGQGSDWEREHLLFRDQLRARPDLAAAYAQLKQDLSREVGSDRFAYTEGNTNFIRRVVEAPTGMRKWVATQTRSAEPRRLG